ncbi:uncharacterized protein LOC118267472 isoform X2 [Spodoptera frugiperda]|nr:uncharacterized protein LOC118267472 isoform X2 [Spodoptera frugiperda]
MAYGCSCFTPISYLIVTIWILVALYFAASIALFCGIANDDALLCTIWIWFTVIFVAIMLMMMIMLALLFTSRRQRSRVFITILGMLWYILTIYFILVVNSHRKTLSKDKETTTIKAPPAGGAAEKPSESPSGADSPPAADSSPDHPPSDDAPSPDAPSPDAPPPDAPAPDAPAPDAPAPDAPAPDAPPDEPPPDEPPPDGPPPEDRKARRKSGQRDAKLSRLTTATPARPMLQCTMVPTIRHKKGPRLYQYEKKEIIPTHTTFHQG